VAGRRKPSYGAQVWVVGDLRRLLALHGEPVHAFRLAGALYAAGGALGLVALAFPGGGGSSVAVSAGTSAVAVAVGAAVVLLARRLPVPLLQALALGATALTAASAYYGGAEGWTEGFYLFWIGLYCAWFFSLEAAVVQALAMAAAYAPAISLDRAIADRELVWFLTATTVGVTVVVAALLRRRLEAALAREREQVERLRELDRLKDDFVATVSHELRTPVAAVYGALQTIVSRDLPEPRRAELLRVSQVEALRLAELTERLLTAATLDRGAEVELRPVDAAVVALEAVESARAREPRRAIAFAAAAGSATVLADFGCLQQALGAILDNALKYGRPDGQIEVEVEPRGGRVRILVRDDGPGIPELERERVFQKFHRLDPEMSDGVGGSGLGLAIARGLVRAMRGDAWIESQAAGTTVVVELALAAPERSAAVACA